VNMDTLVAARALMGFSLAFHILYAAVGVGLTPLLMIAEGISLATGNEIYHKMARAWARPAAVLFAIGAVSGTVLSFEFGLLWPRMIAFAGGIFGLPFALEAFAFFLEAIFVGLYLYGERRLSRRALFLCTIPIVLSSALSDFFVISANGWMNTPTGFTLADGQLVAVDPIRAMFSAAMPHQVVHGTLANYIAVGIFMAGIYALAMLRGHHTDYNRRALTLTLLMATVVLPTQVVTGDWGARFLATNEPKKLAAMEALFQTTAGAPVIIGGWPDVAKQQVRYGLPIPKLLSLLAFFDANATVRGLDTFPAGTTPDPRLVHPAWDIMIGLWALMVLVIIWFWLRRWRHRHDVPRKGMLRAMVVAAPLGLLAIEFGWFTTEFGRQPYVAQGYMQVSEGVTMAGGIGLILVVFVLVYAALTTGLLWLLLHPPAGARTGGNSEEDWSYGD
jgi:cytochrome bd ubiquinol oxidase subunit I